MLWKGRFPKSRYTISTFLLPTSPSQRPHHHTWSVTPPLSWIIFWLRCQQFFEYLLLYISLNIYDAYLYAPFLLSARSSPSFSRFACYHQFKSIPKITTTTKTNLLFAALSKVSLEWCANTWRTLIPARDPQGTILCPRIPSAHQLLRLIPSLPALDRWTSIHNFGRHSATPLRAPRWDPIPHLFWLGSVTASDPLGREHDRADLSLQVRA